MSLEKSAGAVIFRKEGDKIYYLLLHYPSSSKTKRGYWDLPKGHIEKGEKIEDTAKREVREETGLTDISFVGGFKEGIKYFFRLKGENIFKIVTFLLAETRIKEVKISFEHIGAEWLLYEKAIERLTFKNAKEILKKANEYLSQK
jgi:8-oxo-dGTP pyrophosphatase MutT (NUDIX family)